jgi:hypothetical protein
MSERGVIKKNNIFIQGYDVETSQKIIANGWKTYCITP